MNIAIIIVNIILMWVLILNLVRVPASFVKTARAWRGPVSKYLNGLRVVIHFLHRVSYVITEPVLKIVRRLPFRLFIPAEAINIRTHARELFNRSGRKPRRGLLIDLSPLMVTMFLLAIVVRSIMPYATA